MSKNIRKILYIFFIIVFFTATPLLLIYALGYDLNLTWPPRFNMMLQKTGMLIIDSEPKNAMIYLDGKLQTTSQSLFSSKETITTPAKIKNLAPGEYDVKITMDGYWPWEKKLNIYPGSNTFAENIILFKNNLPVRLYEKPCQSMSLSSDQKYITAICDDKVILYNLSNDTSKQIASSSNKFFGFTWSPNNDKISFFDKIYLLNDDKTITFESKSVSDTEWINDNLLYFSDDNGIYEFNVSTYSITQIIKSNNKINDLIIHNKKVYYLENNNGRNDLIIYDISKKEVEMTINIPFSSEYKLTWDGIIYAHDISHSKLYLLDPKNPISPLSNIIENCSRFIKVDENRLICSNEFEIFQYDLTEKSTHLFARISEPISSILWHKSNNYIIYSTNEGIYSFELDDREKHNTTKISTIKNVFDLKSDKDSNLYFISSLDNFPGIFKQFIK